MQLKYFLLLLFVPLSGMEAFAQTINTPNLGQTYPSGSTAGISTPVEVDMGNGINFITTYVPMLPVSDGNMLIPGCDPVVAKQQFVYTDGSNTPYQSVNRYVATVNGQPKHLVQIADNRTQADQYSFLPFTIGSGDFVQNAFQQQRNYYDGLYHDEGYTAFSKTVNSSTTGDRKTTTFAPGKSQVGQSHGTITKNITNAANQIRTWDIDANGLPVSTGFYTANQLFGTETILPSGNTGLNHFTSAQTRTYTDKHGRLILKMVADDNYHPVGGAQVITYQSTYYVYDIKGNLIFTIPPKAVEFFDGNNATFQGAEYVVENLCFKNSYDAKGRLTGTHKPGEQGMIRIVYDRKNRPVMRQTPKEGLNAEWEITFYNRNGTVKATSVFESDGDQVEMQSTLDSWTGGTTADLLYYLATDEGELVTPGESAIAGNTIMSYAYYDNYDIVDPAGALFDSYTSGPGLQSSEYYNTQGAEIPKISMRVQGMGTGSRVRILPSEGYIEASQTGLWRTTVNYYDDKGRVLYIVSRDLNENNAAVHEHYTSMQYDFAGRAILSKHVMVNNNSDEALHTEFNKSQYENATGNLLKTWHKVDGGAWIVLDAFTYDDMGRVKRKSLGDGGEVQDYTYNIRGQLTGINGEYAETGYKAGVSKTFGESLKYDYGFTKNRYDGKMAGMVWRGSSMQDMYAYGYDYSQNQDLKRADFNTYPMSGTSWNHASIDYSVSNIVYDKNGNIMSMNQRGVDPLTGPLDMDILSYNYNDWGNQLSSVQDGGENLDHAGDFKQVNTGGVDGYQYDANGNLTKDRYKGIDAIHYTRFNKPSLIEFHGGKIIEYVYDAAGNKMEELVKDDNNSILKATEYIGNFIYENNTLQYILTAEGRTVFDKEAAIPVREEYFVKDHLGNVRSVINTYTYQVRNYLATYELASANLESLVFDNLDEIREYKPGGDQGDYMAAMLDAADPKTRIGSSLLVHVMAGDRVSMNVNNYYESYNHYDESVIDGNDVLASVVGTLTGGSGGFAGSESHNPKLVDGLFNGENFAAFNDMVTAGNTDPFKPKAYLNYILFDENMSIVGSMSGAFQANGDGNWTEIGTATALEVPKNGYLAIYLSNASYATSTGEGYRVFFDRLRLTVTKGNLLEETHYYPFGLPIKGLNSAEVTDDFKQNRRKYQGNEYITDLGLNWMDFQNRQYDPQLGRFLSIDPLAALGGQDMVSPYAAMGNTPESNVDPNGLIPNQALKFYESRQLRRIGTGEDDPRGGGASGDWSHALGDWAAGGNFDIWGSLGDFGGSTATRVEAARARDKAEMDGGDMQNGTTEGGGATNGGATTDGGGNNSTEEANTGGDPTPEPDPDPQQGRGLPREGGNLSPKSFNFTQSTSATYEAGVSGLFYVVNVQGMSPLGGFSEKFDFQTLYVQFPSSTKNGRKFSTTDASRISADAFNDAAKSVALSLKFYTSIQASRLTYREVQNMVVAAAQFYISTHITAGATITNRPFGRNTIVTPAIWGR